MKAAQSCRYPLLERVEEDAVVAVDEIFPGGLDATEIGIAFVGNEEVYARMTGGNRAAYLDRLFSRIGKRLSLAKSTEADIATLIEAWGIDDPTK